MYYTQAELYAGSTYGIVGYSKKGRPRYGHIPLDPAKYQASMEFYHPKPKPEPPKPPQQTPTTIAAVGDSVRRPKKKRARTTLASLRIRPRARVNSQVGGLTGGGNLPLGGIA